MCQFVALIMRIAKVAVVWAWVSSTAVLAQSTISYLALTTPNDPLDSLALRIYSPLDPVYYNLDIDPDGPEYTSSAHP
jgi:hypothetical protein